MTYKKDIVIYEVWYTDEDGYRTYELAIDETLEEEVLRLVDEKLTIDPFTISVKNSNTTRFKKVSIDVEKLEKYEYMCFEEVTSYGETKQNQYLRWMHNEELVIF